ncbi:MAG TPA: BON domain-containing protein [Roseiflexaceae bacterium]|nr:BON domain-containing protein [Roseiflexaceae bacterium]
MKTTKLPTTALLALGAGAALWIWRTPAARQQAQRLFEDVRTRTRDSSNVSYWLEQWRMTDGKNARTRFGLSGGDGVPGFEDENLTITQRVRTNLGHEPALNDLPHLNVNTEGQGVLYLRGYVHTEEQRRVAQQIASNTEGVSRVVNELNIEQAVNL